MKQFSRQDRRGVSALIHGFLILRIVEVSAFVGFLTLSERIAREASSGTDGFFFIPSIVIAIIFYFAYVYIVGCGLSFALLHLSKRSLTARRAVLANTVPLAMWGMGAFFVEFGDAVPPIYLVTWLGTLCVNALAAWRWAVKPGSENRQ